MVRWARQTNQVAAMRMRVPSRRCALKGWRLRRCEESTKLLGHSQIHSLHDGIRSTNAPNRSWLASKSTAAHIVAIVLAGDPPPRKLRRCLSIVLSMDPRPCASVSSDSNEINENEIDDWSTRRRNGRVRSHWVFALAQRAAVAVSAACWAIALTETQTLRGVLLIIFDYCFERVRIWLRFGNGP
jgi:hypothetical protein